ncbi:MAG: hypothetical protein JNG90_18570, partial [Planctomycetaceae bacterium]|nr:hypothetical protein [Planctomycetaceae bacterium]
EARDGIEGEAGDESSLAEVKFFETQLATATPLDLSGASAWQVKPDPLATPRKPARIALPERRDIFDNYESVLIPPGPLAYVIISSRHPNGVATRAVACDLETRKVAKDAEFYLGQVPLDVSPDSRRMVSCGIRWSGDEDATLTLFEIDQFKTTPKFRWQPYAGEWGHYKEIEWARFVDADHLATMSRWGQLALWDLARGKPEPVYAGRADIRGARAVFSPGRKYLVVLTGKGISFLDPLDGSSLGYIDTQTQGFASHLGHAISPDGGKLALVDHGRVRTWDLATGEQARDFTLAEGRSTDQLVWCDDQHLLTGNGDLIDLDRRIVIWKYSGIDSPLWSTGEAVWGISGSRTGEASLLIGAKLPHKEALRAAETLDADALLVIRPGLDVSLRMSFSGSADEQERVRQALTARLEQVGMKVVPQSNVVLSATIRPGEAQKVQYRNFNGGSYTEHTVQTQILELAYLVDNKPVWKHQRQSWTPAVLHLSQGESIQQALSRAMKQDAKTFESIAVPAHVAITPPGWPPTSPWSGG